ncbi:MAG: DNA repair protein [Flavobacterium psychrophilum]|nr:MAG: DNA repair protein [Flavobacterium psychrophilum]
MGVLKNDFSKVAEIELVYKNNIIPSKQPIIKSSKDAYRAFIETWDMNKLELQEQFRMILLDHKNGILGITTVSTGGLTNCPVDVRLIFAIALKARATAIIISHNHPSGSLMFSEPDRILTSELCKAGQLLKIPVLDHIIVTKEGYISFGDMGVMPHLPRGGHDF